MVSDELVGRLKAAAEGSRELSDEVLVTLGWRRSPNVGSQPAKGLYTPDGHGFYVTPPDPTRSVDDAIALVPASCAWKLTQRLDGLSPTALLQRRGYGRKPFDIWVDVEAATPALALSLALCRAAKRIRAREE